MNLQDECPVECPFGQVILDTNLTDPDILEKILTITSWGKEGMLTGLLLFVDCRVPSEKLYRFVLMALYKRNNNKFLFSCEFFEWQLC